MHRVRAAPVLTIDQSFTRGQALPHRLALMRLGLVSVVTALLCSLALGCGNTVVPASTSTTPTPVALPAVAPSLWAGSWGAAMTNAVAASGDNSGNDQSYRFLVTPTLGGTEERVRFSNVYGATPVTVGAARLSVGQDDSPAVDPEHDVALSFGGQPGTTLAAGQVVTSDPVRLTFSYGQTLAISDYLKGAFGPVSRHDALFVKNYRSPAGSGDTTADTAGTSYTQTLSDWLMVSGVDVYGPYKGTLAMFGSSTTDGFHSNYGSSNAYPVPNVPVAGQHTSRVSDWLALRLHTAGYSIGVVNLGVPGDTVTAEISNPQGMVKNANDRIAQDLLTLPNLVGVVTYFGSIDLRSSDCQSAPAIETATQRMVATAAAAKVPIVVATLPPSAFCTNPAEANYGPSPSATDPYAGGPGNGPVNGAETQRLAFNAWVRQTGAQLPGVAGIADYDTTMADPNHPDFLLPLYNSGDNYHPNGAGYQAQAGAIPLSFLPK